MEVGRGCILSKLIAVFLALQAIPAQAQGTEGTRGAKYILGVIILDNLLPTYEPKYRANLRCALQHEFNSSVRLEMRLGNVAKDELNPRGVLDALCGLGAEISTVVLILRDSNSYDYLPIYKYTVNYISSLGIPLIVWNSYMPRVGNNAIV